MQLTPRLILARIRKRDENGPTDELTDPEWMLCSGDQYYPLHRLTGAPGLTINQLAPVDAAGEILRQLRVKATAKVLGIEHCQHLAQEEYLKGYFGIQLPAGTDVQRGDRLAAKGSIQPPPNHRETIVRDLLAAAYETFCDLAWEGNNKQTLEGAIRAYEAKHGELQQGDEGDNLVWQAILWGANRLLGKLDDLLYDRQYAEAQALVPGMQPRDNPGWTEYELLMVKEAMGKATPGEQTRLKELFATRAQAIQVLVEEVAAIPAPTEDSNG